MDIVHLPEMCQAQDLIPSTMKEKEGDRMRIKGENDKESGGGGRRGGIKRKGIHEEDREGEGRRIRRRMGRMRKRCVLLTSDFESKHVAKAGEREQQRLS